MKHRASPRILFSLLTLLVALSPRAMADTLDSALTDVSSVPVGYAFVQAYPRGAVPLPLTGDLGGPCTGSYCISFIVLFLGQHSYALDVMDQDDCGGSSTYSLGSGGSEPVTSDLSRITASASCSSGVVTASLFVDGVLVGVSLTRY